MNELDRMAEEIYEICVKRDWSKDWAKGGCYIHLEVSEFIEALRGKGADSPSEEAADILFALFSVLANYNIKPSEVISILEDKIKEKAVLT